MSRVRLLFSEAWSSISANVSTTFAATMTVLIGMCLLGLFIALGTWVLSWSDHVQRELQVHVYFQSDATQQQETAVQQNLQNDPRVKQVIFVSKAQAQEKMKKLYPQLYKVKLLENPLPDSYTVVPLKASDTPLLGKDVQTGGWSGVDAVKWGSATAKRVLTIAKVISLVFLIAVILLVVASTLLIANTIRLSIFARRREIEVMKLVGASNWFVRVPFMLEGMVQGVAGAIGGTVAVFGLQRALTDAIPVNSDFWKGWYVSSGDAFQISVIVVLLGAGIGALGALVGLRRFLDV